MAIRRHGRSPFYQEIKEWTWSVDRLELGLLVSEESGTRCFSWVLLSCPHSKNKKHQGLLSAFIPSPHIMVTLQPGLLKIRGLQFPVNELLTPRKMSIGIGQMQTKSGRLMMTATTNVLDLQASKFKESWSVSVSVSVSLSLFLYIYNISLYLSISISLSIYQSIYISICLSLSLCNNDHPYHNQQYIYHCLPTSRRFLERWSLCFFLSFMDGTYNGHSHSEIWCVNPINYSYKYNTKHSYWSYKPTYLGRLTL